MTELDLGEYVRWKYGDGAGIRTIEQPDGETVRVEGGDKKALLAEMEADAEFATRLQDLADGQKAPLRKLRERLQREPLLTATLEVQRELFNQLRPFGVPVLSEAAHLQRIADKVS